MHPAASTFKVAVALEVFCQAAEGRFSLTDRMTVPSQGRALGPTGLSVMRDPVELSIRDLALSMITVSDNCATDVMGDLVGLDRVQARLDGLGLHRTRIRYDCRGIFATAAEDLGIAADLADLPQDEEVLAGLRWVDPAQTNASTAREMTALLSLIWTDGAGPAEACDQVREVMGLQVWPHRLTSGFPADVQLAGKTGTLPSVHNEVAVATWPDGGRYAVAVFARSTCIPTHQPAVDAAIGRAGRLAVDALRS